MQRPHNIPGDEPGGPSQSERLSQVKRAKEASLHSLQEAKRHAKEASKERRRYRWHERLFPRQRSGVIRLLVMATLSATALVVLLALLTLTPMFAINHINVSGVDGTTRERVESALAVFKGKPAASISEVDVKQQLAKFKEIQSFQSNIELPRTLAVNVVPRIAIGYRQVGTSFEVFDAAGVVLDTVTKAPGSVPRFTNAPGSGASFDAAAAVMLSLPAKVRHQVATVTAKTQDDVTLTLDGNRTVLWGNADQSGLKATVLAALLKAEGDKTTFDVSAPGEPLVQ